MSVPLSKELVEMMYQDLKSLLPWLGQYLKPTGDTVRKMTDSMNKLRSRMQPVARKLEEICGNGWSPRDSTIEWIHKGLDYNTRVRVIVDRYINLGHRRHRLLCPCYTVLSSRQINMEALSVIVDVLRHYADGETYEDEAYETVAIRGASYPDVLQDLRSIIPEVKQLHRYSEKLFLSPGPSSPGPSSFPADFVDDEIYVFHAGRICTSDDMQNIDKPELSGFSRYRAFSRCEEEDSTPVMIRVKAPRYTYGCRRSPIDLVMVLDITGSMAGEKLRQIKHGAQFVVRNLQAEDRLSVVALDKCTHLLFPLTYLTDDGMTKALAKQKIAELPSVPAACDIILVPAMEAVHQILSQREELEHRLGRVMVLTDGKAMTPGRGDYPTYTLGLGPEHDRWKTYGVASQGHGTYSFDLTTDLKSIGAAMALCIGGLTSIAAQRIEISIRSEQAAGVRISRITSGAYHNHVGEDGTLGSVIVDDIYSSEEKNFLVYVNVPKDEAAAGGFFPRTTKTKLLTVEANYYSPVSNSTVWLDPVELSVERKGQTQASSQAVEVAGEVIRARVFEEVAKIVADNQEIGRGLAAVRSTMEDTPEAMAAKDAWDDLRRDLDSMEDSETGLAFMLSWLTSHQWQRAAMPGSVVSKISFRTTRMNNLIDSVDLAPLDMGNSCI